MLHASLLCASLALQSPEASARPIQTVADALFTVERCTGAAQPVGDRDGDGVPDLVVDRDGDRAFDGEPHRLECVSTKSGETLRVLWEFPESMHRVSFGTQEWRRAWDVRGDVDGDGIGDVVIGLWTDDAAAERAGRVVVLSGASGEPLYELRGDDALDGFGYEVAFVGDQDGDRLDDFAVGAPQARLEEAVLDRSNVKGEGIGVGLRTRTSRDGFSLTTREYARRCLAQRSHRPGYVSLRSGKDGAELLRIHGRLSGHALGTRVRRVGDLDRDGVPEVALGLARQSDDDLLLVSVRQQAVVCRVANLGGAFLDVGDVNGDGAWDLLQPRLDEGYFDKAEGPARISFGPAFTKTRELPLPDGWSAFTTLASYGDADGDGYADVIVGEGNFNLLAPSPHADSEAPRLAGMSIAESLALTSTPQIGGRWESGCVRVHSGKDLRVIQAVYGEPGMGAGIGLEVGAFPDVTGDGLPELLVGSEDTLYVFAGPGKAE